MSPHYRKCNSATTGGRQNKERRLKQTVTLQSPTLLLQQALTAGKIRAARGEFLAVTGENLPETAEITLEREKEVLEQAEITLQQEKIVL